MTVYKDYPLDPLQITLIRSKDYSLDNNRLRRMVYEEFTTQFPEMDEGKVVPAAIAIMRSDDEDPEFFQITMLTDHFYPHKAPS